MGFFSCLILHSYIFIIIYYVLFYISTFHFYISTFLHVQEVLDTVKKKIEKKVQLGWAVPEDSVRGFREAVIREWGQKYAYFGEELGRAMDRYVENHMSHPRLHARTHVQLSTRGLNTAQRIIDRIRSKFISEVLEKDVNSAIQLEAGTNERTLKHYKNVLLSFNWLEFKSVGDREKPTIYRIAREPEAREEVR